MTERAHQRPDRCPSCGSRSIETLKNTAMDVTMYEARCHDCKHFWDVITDEIPLHVAMSSRQSDD